MTDIPNIAVYEQQILNVSSSSSSGAFVSQAAQVAKDCMVVNEGSVGVQLIFSNSANPTAVNSTGAGGTTQIRIPPGAVMNISKVNSAYFAAITDSGVAKIFLHAGSGS